jgi:ABC-type sugar transport system ATPase subunit
MIYVTHDQIEAMTMADRIVVLRGGRVEQVGKPLDLYNHPANRFVAGFIGAPQMNFLAGQLSGQEVALDCGLHRTLPLARVAEGDAGAAAAQPMPVTLGIRPERVAVSLDGAGDLTARVENFEQLGAVTYIYCALPNKERLTVQHAQQIPLTRGQSLGVSFPTEALHLFGPDDRALEVMR